MKPVMKEKPAPSTKPAKKSTAATGAVAKKATPAPNAVSKKATAVTSAVVKKAAASSVAKQKLSRAPTKMRQSAVENAPKGERAAKESPSAYVVAPSVFRTSRLLGRIQSAPPQTVSFLEKTAPTHKMQELPDSLEPFAGWPEDPTDEEVNALIMAREDFSYDHS